MDQQENNIFGDDLSGGSVLLKWREYLYVFYERRWVAITTFLVVMISAVIWNYRQIPMYRASASLHIDMSANNILNIPGIMSSGAPAYMYGQYINTQVKSIRSHIFIEAVVNDLKKSKDPAAVNFIRNSSNPVGDILSSMNVKAVDNSRLLRITIQHHKPETTALLANAIAEQFIKDNLNRRMEASMAALRWLDEQTEEQKNKVAVSELAIQEYREKKQMVSLEQQQDIVVSKMKSINTTLTKAENDLAVAHSKFNEVIAQLKDGKKAYEIPIVASAPEVLDAKSKMLELDRSLTLLHLRYKDKHPKVISVKTALDDARKKYEKVCGNVAVGIKADYKRCQATVNDLRTALKKQKGLALELGRMKVEYNALKRNAETDRKLYQTLLERMKETDLAGKLESSNIRINDKAYPPSHPFKPQKAKNIIQASVAGLGLGLMLAMLVHFMDDRIRRIEDFEISLGIPVLGMIPKVKQKTVPQRAMMAFADQDSQVSEAFRGMYAGLVLDNIGQTAQVIMVVSANASEGKSFVSTNLSFVFAYNGERTLLIDADMRRPTQHKLFNIVQHEGMPHFLNGEVEWDDAVVHTEQPGLDLMMGVGVGKVNPAHLLTSSSMEKLLEEARMRYDRIIIDCPPLFGVSDPLLILPKVDGSIFVAFYNKTHQRAVAEATQKLTDSKPPLLGAVINAVELNSHSYYYHRYGYNHYYGRRDDGAEV